jgi:hypothetical protein
MDAYALIMRHEDGSKIASREQMAEWMKQTAAWIDSISALNKFVSGTGLLFDDARTVTTVNAKKVVSSKAFGKSKETIGGYIIVKADSINEAVEFAKGCPVLQGDGNSLEIRKIAH